MAQVQRTDKFRRYQRYMIGELKLAQQRAAEIHINSPAKRKIVDKGHVVTGTLLRSGHVVPTEIIGDVMRTTVSFPPDYSLSIELLPDGGYLFEAVEENADNVRRSLVTDLGESQRRFR